MGISNYKVYTPSEYANIITELALQNYFYEEYTKEKLDNIKIADLSCGTGNLLLSIMEKLIKLSKKISGKYYFLSSWINGYDIDSNAFYLFQKEGESLLKKYNLTGEILGFVEDSLFTEIKNNKYNIIIGNPPYLGEKNHQEIFKKIKETDFGKKYYESKMDYLYYFIEKGIDFLEDNGILVYVTTNYWLKANSAVILRNKLREEGYYTNIIDYNVSIFKNALGQHNMIFSWKKSTDKSNKEINIEKEENIFTLKNNNIYDEKGNIILVDKKNQIFNEKVASKSNFKLGDIFNINQGIVTGYDKAFVTKEYNEKFKDYLKPFYKNKDIFKYNCIKDNYFWIYYMDKDKKISKELEEIFLPHKEALSKRREVQKGFLKWWQLSWARDKEIMSSEKILVRQRCKTNFFAYSNFEFYGSADIYYLTLKDKSFNLFYILGYLNSDIFYRWYRNNGKHKGYNLEFYTTPLKQVPLFYPSKENLNEISYIETLVKKQIENYSEKIQDEINNYFKKIYL